MVKKTHLFFISKQNIVFEACLNKPQNHLDKFVQLVY